jgi:signal transduction histidine kinase
VTSRPLADAIVRASVPLGGVVLMLSALPTLPNGAHAADQFVAAALLATGSVAWLVGRHLQGLCAVLVGGALAAIGNVDANRGSASLRGFAIAAGPLVIPLASAAAGWHARWSWLALAGGVFAGPVRSLVYDPFLDPHCLVCRPSAAAVVHRPDVAQALLLMGLALTVAALALAAFRARNRWVLVSMAVITATTLWRPDLRLVACVIAIGLLGVDIIRIVAAQYRIRVLVEMLRQDADLEQTLRRTLGDPELTVAYCVDEDNDETPETADLPTSDPSGQRVSTELSIDGRLVAVIRHNPVAVEVGELATALDGSARLALDNESQTARLAARTREVQRSRVRIVERADDERRRLERDVHDGAQQHVLALGFDLRIALAGLSADAPSHGVLEQCLQETMGALDDLRELSHGLYPPSLDTGGLVPALRALARRARVPVTIVNMPEARLPPTVERTVFAIVADAAGRARSELSVTVASINEGVEVVIHGDADQPAQAVVDRLVTLGGTLNSSDTTIRAVIPCG